jgi:F0F1-type ATP synthase membrane subunit b/b'
MSDTPNTRAVLQSADGRWTYSIKNFCESVERQLNEVQRELAEERKEGEEQARLLGMGSEREAKLIAERDLWRETAEESFQTRAWKQLIEEEKVRMKRRLEYMVGDDWGNKLPKPK